MYVRLPRNIATLLLKHSNWRKTPRLVFTRAPGGYTAFFTREHPWYLDDTTFSVLYFKDDEDKHVIGNHIEHFSISASDKDMYAYLNKFYEKHLTSD